MSALDNGGPAFPVSTAQANDGEYGHQSGNSTWQFPGMTLRDYFAAKASENDVFDMVGRIPLVERVIADGGNKRIVQALPKNARQIARYMHADEMLKARSM